MSPFERVKIECAVNARLAGDADFVVAGVIALVLAAFVVGVAVGWFAGTWAL